MTDNENDRTGCICWRRCGTVVSTKLAQYYKQIRTSKSILQKREKSNNFGLNTLSMTELYDAPVYQPRKPIADDLLCSGTYLFVGAPKVGKSFFMGSSPTMWRQGLLWEYEVRDTISTLHWRTRLRPAAAAPGFGSRGPAISTLQRKPKSVSRDLTSS